VTPEKMLGKEVTPIHISSEDLEGKIAIRLEYLKCFAPFLFLHTFEDMKLWAKNGRKRKLLIIIKSPEEGLVQG
jgi:hypothetical protein